MWKLLSPLDVFIVGYGVSGDPQYLKIFLYLDSRFLTYVNQFLKHDHFTHQVLL